VGLELGSSGYTT